MKKCIVITLILALTSISLNLAITEEVFVIRDDHQERFSNNPDLTERIIKDIISSFSKDLNFLEQDKYGVSEYFLWDLHKMIIPIGKQDTHLNSLHELFFGDYPSERVLYIVGNHNNDVAGFFLYKKPNGINVLKKIRLGDTKWEVVEIKEKQGEVIKRY